MAVWSPFSADHIWLGVLDGTLPSLREGLGRSLVIPNPQKNMAARVRMTSEGQTWWVKIGSGLIESTEQKARLSPVVKGPGCSGPKRKDPVVKKPVILIVATPVDPLCVYTENGKTASLFAEDSLTTW